MGLEELPLRKPSVEDTMMYLIGFEEGIDKSLQIWAKPRGMIPEDEIMQDVHEGLDVVT